MKNKPTTEYRKLEFPNQKCAVKNCKKPRKHLAILVGAQFNLCDKHLAMFEDEQPLEWKEFQLKTVARIIHE